MGLPNMVLEHATYYHEGVLLRGKTISVRDGMIEKIDDEPAGELLKDGAALRRDCTGEFLYPAFFDTHLHFPGKMLYTLFGMDLIFQESTEDYFRIIERYWEEKKVVSAKDKSKNELNELKDESKNELKNELKNAAMEEDAEMKSEQDDDENQVHKGFGWNEGVLERENGFERIRMYLEQIFGAEKVILFSDDFHHAICNDAMKQLLWEKYPDIVVTEGNRIEKDNIFKLLERVEEIQFTEAQIEEAVLLFQENLWNCGITAVQTLLFMGGNGKKEYQVLKRLDEEKKLRLTVRTACTVYPFESLEQIQEKYEAMKQWDSEHIRLRNLKLYLDGVVDNKTAFLLENYERDTTRGACYWNMDQLKQVCTWADAQGIQIHIHAVGDGAVHAAVTALRYAMDENGSIGKNHPVVAHLQLAEDADIVQMGKYGIIAAIQPYWISAGDAYYSVDRQNLGERVYEEYKINTFFENGVLVTGSSDSPVVLEPLAFRAMRQALLRGNRREVPTIQQLLQMFTLNGAKQLGMENEYGSIEVGKRADFLVLNEPVTAEAVCKESVRILERLG